MNNNIDEEKDVNKENEDKYNDLIEKTRRKNDGYWDINNPFIKIVLLILFVIGVVGAIYYIALWLQTK
ncbi:MAG: PspC domain-containing protein [Bacilli bacterium]|nr:PspC domain-containing protein [Bacilli bacterium]